MKGFMKPIFGVLILTLFTSNVHAVATRGCSNSQKRTLDVVHMNVMQRLLELTDPRTGINNYSHVRIKRDYVIPENLMPSKRFTSHDRTYSTFHQKVAGSLALMKNKMQSGFPYHCMTESTRHCQGGGGVQAYVLFLFGSPYNRIHLCPLFFSNDMRDMEETILHELSHLAANTEHYFGTSLNDEGMIKSANDAYLYGRMMGMPLESMMRVNSWGLIWTKSPKEMENLN